MSATLGRARYVRVVYLDRGRIEQEDVLHRHCYEDLAIAGFFERFQRLPGQVIDVEPSTEERCAVCQPAANEPVFVGVHRCEHCGHSTDAKPCTYCGDRGLRPGSPTRHPFRPTSIRSAN
jgi:hypothetical protein